MKWVFFGVLALVLVLAGGAVMFPMSVAAGFVADRFGDLKYAQASGSVWNGKLIGVNLGDQPVGDVSIQTDPMKLFGGAAEAKLGIVRGGFTGQGRVSYALAGGTVSVSDLLMTGPVSEVAGLPDRLSGTDGRFSMQFSDIQLSPDGCVSATGQVWTDALAKLDFEGDWTGPELRGPISCSQGGLSLEAAGQAPTGESVTAGILIGDGFRSSLVARIDGAQGRAAERLMETGFLPEDASLVLRRQLGG